MNKKTKKVIKKLAIALLILLIIDLFYYAEENYFNKTSYAKSESYTLEDIPEYSENGYVIINNNEPEFTDSDKTTKTFEQYSNLDFLGRCGVAYANVSKETMPTEKRGEIGSIKPSGWQTVKYSFIEGKYLYNRCHLIGYQLTGENANAKNLITCTRYMNATTMLEFENKVAKYVKDTNNHVLYRVTPIFGKGNMLASGAQMEAYSVEDNGKGIKFNIYVYNVQDGVIIDYKTGKSKKA